MTPNIRMVFAETQSKVDSVDLGFRAFLTDTAGI
jgi:hypothetical protein